MQQQSFFASLFDLLMIDPTMLSGLVLLAGILIWLLRGATRRQKGQVMIASVLLYFFWVSALTNIFGTPSLAELERMHHFGEALFQPKLELRPLADGFSLSFLLNILVFMPFGFLLPLISPRFQRVRNVLLLAAATSLAIELSQLFTLYRATDINDLLTNTLGAGLGFGCYWLIARLSKRRPANTLPTTTKDLPIVILLLAAFVTFF